MVEKIQMNVNETLELEYLIEQISDSAISIDEEPTPGSSSVDYIARKNGVFNPTETGIHKLSINGQTVEIDVTDIPDEIVTYWTFDSGDINSGTLSDSADSNPLALNNSPTVESGLSSTYDSGDSLDFDGSTEYGESSGGKLDGLTNWSVTFWTSTDSRGIKQWPLCQKDDFNNFGVFNDGSNGNLDIFFNSSQYSNFGGSLSSTPEHIAITSDGSTLEMFRDGSSAGTASISGSLSNTNGLLVAVRQGFTEYFDGNVDGLRLYNKTLTSTEVSNDYNIGSINV